MFGLIEDIWIIIIKHINFLQETIYVLTLSRNNKDYSVQVLLSNEKVFSFLELYRFQN